VFHIALYEPEIPPNAGNVARLCAATGSVLHFIGRLGFRMDDKTLKRAGLDYWPHVNWKRHETWDDFVESFLRDRPSPLTPLPQGERGELSSPPSRQCCSRFPRPPFPRYVPVGIAGPENHIGILPG